MWQRCHRRVDGRGWVDRHDRAPVLDRPERRRLQPGNASLTVSHAHRRPRASDRRHDDLGCPARTILGDGEPEQERHGDPTDQHLRRGFVQNNNPDVPKLDMCGAWNNRTDYCQTLSQSNAMNAFTMTGAEAKAVARNADGSLPAIH
jgi:hypothetical protein